MKQTLRLTFLFLLPALLFWQGGWTQGTPCPVVYWDFDGPDPWISTQPTGGPYDLKSGINDPGISVITVPQATLIGHHLRADRDQGSGGVSYYNTGGNPPPPANQKLHDAFSGLVEEFSAEIWFRADPLAASPQIIGWRAITAAGNNLIRLNIAPARLTADIRLTDGVNAPVFITITFLLNQLDRKNISYYMDGNWHQLVLTYTNNDPVNNENLFRLFVDGYNDINDPDFNATLPAQTPALSLDYVAPGHWLDLGSYGPGKGYSGDIDEVALWQHALTDQEVLEHYRDVLAESLAQANSGIASTYDYCQSPLTPGNYTPVTPPVYTTGALIEDQFPPNYPSHTAFNCTDATDGVATALSQLQSFPTARLHHDVPLHRNWLGGAASLVQLGDYERNPATSWGIAGTNNLSTTNIASNIKDIVEQLALHYNYMIPVMPSQSAVVAGTQTDEITAQLIQLANSNPGITTCGYSILPALRPMDAFATHAGVNTLYNQPPANDITATPNNTAYINRLDLLPIADHYNPAVDNWSYARNTIYDIELREDGRAMAAYLRAVGDELTNNRIDYLVENGEEGSYYYNNNENCTTNLPADQKVANHPEWVLPYCNNPRDFYTRRKTEMRQAYEDGIDLVHNDASLTPPEVIWYNPTANHHATFSWEHMRSLNENTASQRFYSTMNFYPNRPSNIIYPGGVLTGLLDNARSRTSEFASNDFFSAPFVTSTMRSLNGGTSWTHPDWQTVRPGQYLGSLKNLMGMGAEYFHAWQENYTHCEREHRAEWFVWNLTTPGYVQGVVSRTNDLFQNSTALEGDFDDFYAIYGIYEPVYAHWAGDVRYVVNVRKGNGAQNQNQYMLAGSIHTTTDNDVGEDTPREDLAEIVINRGYSNAIPLSFEIRRQGSVYIFDRNPARPPVVAAGTKPATFIQYDHWHEATHPAWWSNDFSFQAEVHDGATAAQGGEEFEPWTEVIDGNMTFEPIDGDYSNFTSFMTIEAPSREVWCDPADAPSLEYRFQVRNPNDHYLYVRARLRPGASLPTGLWASLDQPGNPGPLLAVNTLGCIDDPDWQWYAIDLAQGTPVTYPALAAEGYLVRISPFNSDLQIDQVLVSTSASPALVAQVYTGACTAPTAAFAVSASGVCDQIVSLTDQSTGLDECPSYSWDFGDGSGSTSPNPIHTYAGSGSYLITLTVTNQSGLSSVSTTTVNVTAASFYIGPDRTTCGPSCVSFNVHFPDPNCSYSFKIMDGANVITPVGVQTATRLCINTAATFTQPGTYTIIATANCGTGCEGSDQALLTILDPIVMGFTCKNYHEDDGCCPTGGGRKMADAGAESSSQSFDVFPNPSQGQFRIEIKNSLAAPTELVLVDAHGRVVMDFAREIKSGQTAWDVNAGDLADGIYLLRLRTSEGGVNVRSVVIEH